MKKIVIITLLFLFLLISDNPAPAETIKVIASITPLADFARQVGGDKADVTLLLPPGASPHTYEPTPKALHDVSRARVFIKVGSGLEFWAEKIIKSAGDRNLIIVDASSGLPLLKLHDEDHVHSSSGTDPHIWLDPVLAQDIVTKIEKAFMKADPKNSDFYKRNASIYREKLALLDREISGKVEKFRFREYVTFHPAWNYFSNRYGLKVAGVVEESPGKEPGPKHIEQIIREIKRIGSKVVFVEPQFNKKIAEVIAREGGAGIAYLDPIGGVKGRETYIDMMRYNISVMERVMK
jgi:zinc transport system substrate-binding protein